MSSSKCLDLDYFELFSSILFSRKYFSKRLKNIFDEFDNELIVTLGYKIMMMSSKCLDFKYFELFSDTLFRSNNFSNGLKYIFDVIDSEPIVRVGSKKI